MEDSSTAEIDQVPRTKKVPYKRYVYHNSESQISKRTKSYWKRKRQAARQAKSLSETKKRRQIEENRSSTEDSDHGSTTTNESHADASPINAHSEDVENENELNDTANVISIGQSEDLNVMGPIRLHSDESTFSEPFARQYRQDETSSNEEQDDEEMAGSDPRENYSKDFLKKTLLVLATKLRHNLTYEAAQDVVSLLCTESATVIRGATKYYWKKVIEDFSTCLTMHHICECRSYIGVQSDIPLHCSICDEAVDPASKLNNVFIYLSLTYQLREILELTRLHDTLEEKRHKQHDAAFEDIRDGMLYKKHNDADMLTINFSVDGVPVFSSSNSSMYPVLCTINELGPRQRRKYVLLCSLWFGNGKPDINEYLKPFVAETQELHSVGVDYMYQGMRYNKKFRILAGVADSVARPTLRNSTQFNGEYGCGLCLHPGETIVKGKGMARVYPLAADGNAFGEGLRSHDQTMEHVISEEYGMKGRSILCDIPGFDIISSLDVDWMHAVALGVCRQFARLWFDSTNSNEEFYCGHLVKQVDALLLSYQPTLEVSRTPRMMSERKHWKAHEWVIFLLFYSLPTLFALFPRKLTNHWALLVDGIQILCKKSIMKSEIVYAEQSLLAFIKGVEQCYGRKHVSFNVHLLAHLARSVQNLGPLWTHSAFVYENANQELLKYIQSSNGVTIQICDTFRAKCVVDRLYLLYFAEMRKEQQDYLNRLLRNKVSPSGTPILENVSLLGVMTKHETLPRHICLAFERSNVTVDERTSTESYKRVEFHGETIHSKSYKVVKKRCNYYVQLVNNEIFEIELFYVLKKAGNAACYALGRYFEKSNRPFIDDRRLEHMIVLPKRLDDLAVINIVTIKEKVTMLHLNHSQVSLACIHPNHNELLT